MFRNVSLYRAVRRRGLGFAAIVATAILITSCQSGGPSALALEEAKKVTADLAGQSFVPPPRTLEDITAILDQIKPADRSALESARLAATQDPPPNLGKPLLMSFYYSRSKAANVIGDAKQQLDDLKKAAGLASTFTDFNIRSNILTDLGLAEFVAGDAYDAKKHVEKALEIIPSTSFKSLGRSGGFAVALAAAGDLVGAEKWVSFAEKKLAEASTQDFYKKHSSKWLSNILRARASILDAQGLYAQAEPLHRSSLKYSKDTVIRKTSRNAEHSRVWAQALLAENLANQGRLVEAEIEAREVLNYALTRLGRHSPETAFAIGKLAIVISGQGRYAEAEKLVGAVSETYRTIGSPANSWLWAIARRYLAETLVHQGKWEAALEEYDTINKALSAQPDILQTVIGADINWPIALFQVGRVKEAHLVAKRMFNRQLKALGETHYGTAMARAILATTLAELGETKLAIDHFSFALPILMSSSQFSETESVSRGALEQQLHFIFETYIDLLSGQRHTGLDSQIKKDVIAETFLVANMARRQTVQRALSASSARATTGNPELTDVVRREQDAQKQIAGLNALLVDALSRPEKQREQRVVADLRSRINRLRSARATLKAEIDDKFPDYAVLINPQPATIEQARLALRPGAALIATYVTKRRTYVWAIPQEGEVTFAAVDLGEKELAGTVSRLRAALDPGNVATIGDIPDFDLAAAYGLYEMLLKPVEAGWKGAKSLLVVADGALAQLPLSLLPTKPVKLGPEKAPLFANHRDVPWLARTHGVTVLPSVASLKALRGTTAAGGGRRPFAGFGDPYFSKSQELAAAEQAEPVQVASAEGAIRGLPVKLRSKPQTRGVDSATLALLPRLADTRTEINAIAQALGADPSRDVFLGAKAGEGQVKTMDLSGFKVIAFATHGLVAGDLNGLSQPALALSSPEVTGDREDGLLTMGEILGLKLNADWAVLSACNTAAADGRGAEAVSGLGRAFFYAGTRALLVSNWPVHSAATAELTTDLFRRQAADDNLSRAEALRQTRIHLIDEAGFKDNQGRTVFSYAHPIFWAPFTVVGDGGGARELRS